MTATDVAEYGDTRLPERFWAKVQADPESGCWVWQASLNVGYGQLNVNGRPRLAHRLTWETLIGEVSSGLELDHLCRNRACCNPQHLEPVTRAENIRRSPFARQHRTHCPHGHEYNEENTWRDKRGWRWCRECSRIKARNGGRMPAAVTAAAAVILGGFIAAGGAVQPASATDNSGYVLVAWQIHAPATVNDPFAAPQTIVAHKLLDELSLDALDGQLPCGGVFQIDGYHANNDSAALIAGGVLYGPNNPTEPLAHGAVDGNPWKYLETAPCAEKPEPRPFADSASISDCEYTTTSTREGFFDLTFDPIANVWTENVDPTITAETSSTVPVSVGEKSEACSPDEQLPTLADTGPAPLIVWLIWAGVAILGGLLVAIDAVLRSRAPRYKRGA